MLKLISLLALESGREDPHAEVGIRAAARFHPGLTVEQFVRGVFDAAGHQRMDGYVGWFWLKGKRGTPEQVARICAGLQCSPGTPLASILEITV